MAKKGAFLSFDGKHTPPMVNSKCIYELTLTAPDGRERKTLAYLPNEAVKQELYETCRKRGLTVEIRLIDN